MSCVIMTSHFRVQLELPFLVASPIEPARSGFSVEFVRIRRARRYIIRVRHDGTVRVTIPRGGSRAEGTRFIEKQWKWIEKERARVVAAHVTTSWTDGATLMLRGELVTLRVGPDARGSAAIRYGGRSVALSRNGSSIRGCIE